ncbi:MAG: putative RNA methyltransferase, partial [Thiohalomonadales bacterium]
MEVIKAHNLACPIDNESLILGDKQLKCCNGHSYDIARQGYINLLPVQLKRSKEPGDSKEMVIARTRFLNQGFYEPIAKKLTDIIKKQLNDINNNTICLFDAGCGEGYYLDSIVKSLAITPENYNVSLIGLDISKYAIHEAAKRT